MESGDEIASDALSCGVDEAVAVHDVIPEQVVHVQRVMQRVHGHRHAMSIGRRSASGRAVVLLRLGAVGARASTCSRLGRVRRFNPRDSYFGFGTT